MNKIKTSTGRRGIQVYNSVMANLESKFRFFRNFSKETHQLFERVEHFERLEDHIFSCWT